MSLVFLTHWAIGPVFSCGEFSSVWAAREQGSYRVHQLSDNMFQTASFFFTISRF